MATKKQKPIKKTQLKQEETKNKGDYIWAVGRRKRAVARVRLYSKDKKSQNVDIIVNNKPVGQYFHDPKAKLNYAEPLRITNTLDRYSITVKVLGSGLSSQLDAMLHGISRALIKADAEHRPVLKKRGFLTRDPRERQRRMVGRGGKSRAKKQSPKR